MKLRLTAAVLVSVGSSAFAQVQPSAAPKPYAVIEGVAFDSLHNDVLRGALLNVEGTSAFGFTDSFGRFRIDSVLPGVRHVEVTHWILDTIGIGLRTPPLELAAGVQRHLDVAIPSIQTVVAARCTQGERQIGPAAILGTVQYAESEEPAEGAQVILDFVEIRIVGKSIQSIQFHRTATVTGSGRFKLCGLPEDLSGSLIAVKAQDSTTTVGVHLASLLGIVGLELPEPPAAGSSVSGAPVAASLRTGKAVVTGRVLDPSGGALSRARVSVAGDSAVTQTDAEGRFELRNLRSGTRTISVRRLGFQPAEVAVNLRARTPADVTVRLEKFVAVLDEVIITAAREQALARVGFSKRKTMGTGYYLTPEEISRRSAYDLPSLLAMAPMLRRVYDGGRPALIGRPHGISAGCVSYFVDGSPWMGGGIEDFIRPDEIAAVEVYSSNFTPGQFMRGIDSCETVVIWTKHKFLR